MIKTLEGMRKQKRYFDEDNKVDVELYRQFLVNGNKWGESACPFILEFPSLTVPDMIKDRLIRKFLKVDV
jgi:hypothetical protein